MIARNTTKLLKNLLKVLNSYIIIDSSEVISRKIAATSFFEDFLCLGVFTTYEGALNGILEHKPQLVLFHITDAVPLTLLTSLYQYLDILPYTIGIYQDTTQAYSALKLGVIDYLLFPLEVSELRKSFLRFTKLRQKESDTKFCIKSSGDYHFITLEDIVYLKADNNTTDFYLQNGKKITGFKTMKFYEQELPFYFFRIHHSYIVNVHFVSRITLGKNVCYLLENTFKLPFSRSYKDTIATIIRRIQ